MASNILNSTENLEVVRSLQSSGGPGEQIPMSFEMTINKGWADFKLVGGSLTKIVSGAFATTGRHGMNIQF